MDRNDWQIDEKQKSLRTRLRERQNGAPFPVCIPPSFLQSSGLGLCVCVFEGGCNCLKVWREQNWLRLCSAAPCCVSLWSVCVCVHTYMCVCEREKGRMRE